MKKSILTLALALTATFGFAQRTTDKLDRGLVAVPSGSGNLVSWRIFGEEYYDVTYNLYCNGSKIASDLTTSNYLHTSGNASSQYYVIPVVKGEEKAELKSKSVTRWSNGYLSIPVAKVLDRKGNDVTSEYDLNDVSLGDVNGDSVVEFIVKRNYTGDILNASNTTKFHHYECYTLSGKRLWWIDLGPNLMSGPDEQWDLISFDWDQDGKAECIMRGADNMIIHTADGRAINIGNMNYVAPRTEYTREGAEYLLYMNGETGVPYGCAEGATTFTPMAYPLPRFESGESDYKTVWGENDTGHRATKHYFGAPFLDGRKASIFLARGCYTRHKMCALEVDPTTHELKQQWRWNQYTGGSSWFGNGYHNFAIGDVDWDGRDEIIFGAMIIDDNGKGLCTTGLGHGDAQHCSDFDPYRKYSEQFICNETSPACTYYNATTGKFYFRKVSNNDDGRALMGNFTNEFPGSIGRSASMGTWFSSVTDLEIAGKGNISCDKGDGNTHLNGRIYWDGDLCDEIYDSPGTASYGSIIKVGTSGGSRLLTTTGATMHNSSKNNPNACGDIIGDWREELVVSNQNEMRIYTTSIATTYRIPTLWHDHQYRNAMVWQCVGYNQPPHKSYFLGEMEGITVAPPPYTMTGRTEITNGGTIATSHNGQQVIVCETNNSEVTIADGASPSVAFFNVPSWVQGKNSTKTNGTDQITYTYYTCNTKGGAFTGDTRIVKQGDGILNLPKVNMTNTGNTDIWAGTVNFDGTLKNSDLWLNRFAELNSDGGQFKSIKADYASMIRPGGENNQGAITVDGTYTMGFGSRLVLDLYSDGLKADQINVNTLRIEAKTSDTWMKYGPKYLQPVIEVVEHRADGESTLTTGDYIIGKVQELEGSLASIKVEGITNLKSGLSIDENNNLVLSIGAIRGATEIVWGGFSDANWDFAKTNNFYLLNDEEQTPDIFVKGDIVNFEDGATKRTITLTDDLVPDTVRVNASKAFSYTFKGNGAITAGALVKENTGTLTISNENSYTGGNFLRGGTVKVSSLSNENKATGNLGGVISSSNKFIMENGAILQATAAVTNGSPIRFQGDQGGVINNSADFAQNKGFYGTMLTKKGNGWLKTYTTGTNLTKMVIAAGTVQNFSGNAAKTVELQGGALNDMVSTSNIIFIDAKKKGTWTTTNRCSYSNTLTGEGTIDIYCAAEQGTGWVATRTPLTLNLKDFKGTLIPHAVITADGRFTFDTSNGSADFTLDIPSGVYVQNSGKTLRIGQVTGSGSLGGFCAFSNGVTEQTNTWQVGNEGNFTFAGSVTNKDAFTKLGAGKMTTSGTWTTTGAVRVNDGELHINSGSTIGTGSLTVAVGATLSGATESNIPWTNSSYTINGTLQPNSSTNPTGTTASTASSTIDFNGKNVTFGAKSAYVVGLGKTTNGASQNASIKNIKTLKFTDGATIAPFVPESYLANLTTDENEPDEFTIWTDVTTVSGTPSFDLPELPAWNYWDTSRISEGILIIRCDAEKYQQYLTGISGITDGEIVSVEVVNSNGITVKKFTCSMSAVKATFEQTTLPKGLYMLQIKSASGKKGSMKKMK